MHERAVAGGVFEVEHGRQLVVVDDDGFDRVPRRRGALGDHDGDAVADEAHLVERERAVRRVLHVRR